MNLIEAEAELKQVGCAHCTGDALRAMYAGLLEKVHGGKKDKYYAHMQKIDGDKAIIAEAKRLLDSRIKAWDVLMG